MRSVLPPDEADRVRALARSGVLTSPATPALHALVALTTVEVVAPLVRLDLVDRFRVVPKSVCGGPPTVLPRRSAIAAEVVRTGRGFVVPDMMRHAHWKRHPDVHRGLGARMCIASPLRTPDHRVVGALVAIDVLPRTPSRRIIQRKQQLACRMVRQLMRTASPNSVSEVGPLRPAGVHQPRLRVVRGSQEGTPSMWMGEERSRCATVEPWAIIEAGGRILRCGGGWLALGLAPRVGESLASLVRRSHHRLLQRAQSDGVDTGTRTIEVSLSSDHPNPVSVTFVRRPSPSGQASLFVHVYVPNLQSLSAGLSRPGMDAARAPLADGSAAAW